MVAGTVEHAASCNIIQERCKKVTVIFSPSFFESQENKFLTDFAQYIGIQQGHNCKIIPIILKPCDIPSQLKMYAKLPYKPHGKMFNFWLRYDYPLSSQSCSFDSDNSYSICKQQGSKFFGNLMSLRHFRSIQSGFRLSHSHNLIGNNFTE